MHNLKRVVMQRSLLGNSHLLWSATKRLAEPDTAQTAVKSMTTDVILPARHGT